MFQNILLYYGVFKLVFTFADKPQYNLVFPNLVETVTEGHVKFYCLREFLHTKWIHKSGRIMNAHYDRVSSHNHKFLLLNLDLIVPSNVGKYTCHSFSNVGRIDSSEY